MRRWRFLKIQTHMQVIGTARIVIQKTFAREKLLLYLSLVLKLQLCSPFLETCGHTLPQIHFEYEATIAIPNGSFIHFDCNSTSE